MNKLYLQELLVKLKQQEMQREAEQMHLLREAGWSRPSLLVRAVGALRMFMNRRRNALQDHASVEQQSYQALSDQAPAE